MSQPAEPLVLWIARRNTGLFPEKMRKTRLQSPSAGLAQAQICRRIAMSGGAGLNATIARFA